MVRLDNLSNEGLKRVMKRYANKWYDEMQNRPAKALYHIDSMQEILNRMREKTIWKPLKINEKIKITTIEAKQLSGNCMKCGTFEQRLYDYNVKGYCDKCAKEQQKELQKLLTGE